MDILSCYLRVEAGRAAEELAAAEEDLAAEAARLGDGLPAPVELGVLRGAGFNGPIGTSINF